MNSEYQTPPHPDPQSWADPEGTGVQTSPSENHKKSGFLTNTGPDPLKNHEATKPEFNVGP